MKFAQSVINSSESNIDKTKLPIITSNVIIQVVSLRNLSREPKVHGIGGRGIRRQHTHALFGVLHLPDPPEAVDHPMVRIEDRIAW